MKKCTICKVSKPKSNFNKKSSTKDGLQSKCRKCSKRLFKEYYRLNKQKHYEQTKKNNERYVNRNREYVYQFLLKNPCVDCDETNPIVLDFDHQRDKVNNVSSMAYRAVSIAKLQAEIDKCVVRCTKCHRLKTARDESWWIHRRHNVQ